MAVRPMAAGGPGEDPAPAKGYRGRIKPKATERSERTAQRLLRPIVFCLAASVLLNVALVSLVYSLFPLVRVQPALVQLSDKQFFRIEPIHKNTTSELKAVEAFVRKYVTERETINLVNDRERWKWVHDQSSGRVWEPFIGELERDRTWQKLERDDVRRKPVILASWSLEDDPDRWAVEFDRITTRGFNEVARERWVVSIQLGRIGGRATNEELFGNPFRLRVDRYSIAPKQVVIEEGQS